MTQWVVYFPVFQQVKLVNIKHLKKAICFAQSRRKLEKKLESRTAAVFFCIYTLQKISLAMVSHVLLLKFTFLPKR
jgi:hypothetical protein